MAVVRQPKRRRKRQLNEGKSTSAPWGQPQRREGFYAAVL